MFKKIKKEFVSESKRKLKYFSSTEETQSPYDDIASQMDSELKHLNDMIEWLEIKDSARNKNVQNNNHVLQSAEKMEKQKVLQKSGNPVGRSGTPVITSSPGNAFTGSGLTNGANNGELENCRYESDGGHIKERNVANKIREWQSRQMDGQSRDQTSPGSARGISEDGVFLRRVLTPGHDQSQKAHLKLLLLDLPLQANNGNKKIIGSSAPLRRPHFSPMDHPLRRTMHASGECRQIKRCVGPVSEIFERPTSPMSDSAVRLCFPPRCDSPKRPLSPMTDIVTTATRKQHQPQPMERFISFSSTNDETIIQGGICCERCNNCLIDLKRQALRCILPDGLLRGSLAKDTEISSRIEETLQTPGSSKQYLKNGRCDVCDTHINQLKREAIVMVQSIQRAQTESSPPANIPALVGSCNIIPSQRTKSVPSGSQLRSLRSNRQSGHPQISNYISTSAPIAAQAQAYLEQNVRAWINPKKYNQMLASRTMSSSVTERVYSPDVMGMEHAGNQKSHIPLPGGHFMSPGPYHPQLHSGHVSDGICAVAPGMQSPSAAASFFVRAAQKLNMSSRKKKRHQPPDPDPPPFPTKFCDIIRASPPPAPPCLLRSVGRVQSPSVGKVKVMIKICPSSHGSHSDQGSSVLTVDSRRKQVTLYDPSYSGYTTAAYRRNASAAPKMFAFDAAFSQDDSVTELCSSSLTDIIQAVVNGADGCLFSYGHSKLGKTDTMIGKTSSPQSLGVIPCAIAWLFRLINEQKDKTGARFSVRVSAMEVCGKQETLKDLLSEVAQGQESGVGTAPGVYLREDPICGTQLENQSELRAPTADKAAYYLDAAIAARTPPEDEDSRASHLLFTLHVYQYRIEKANKAGLPGVAGGRSRLHLIDLGSCSKSKDPNGVALSLSTLGNVILALLNGQRHVPHRDSKICQLLRDSLGNLTCRTCMIVHVSSSVHHYNETLQVVQLAARIHRMRRRRTKFSSTSSEDSSCEEVGRIRRPYRGFRMGVLREELLYSSSHSDPDYTSSSEQSCDTVIYLGANGQSLSDRELTDNEGPPRSIPRTNPRLPRRASGSRSSGDEGSTSDSGQSLMSHRFNRLKLGAASRLPLRPTTPTHPGTMSPPIHTPPLSPPISGVVQLPRKLNFHPKPDTAERIGAADMQTSSVNLPPRTNANIRKLKVNADGKSLQKEQWIDGPGVKMFPEQWVDGPQAKPESQKSEHRKQFFKTKVNAEELWIDGPQEMVAEGEISKQTGSPVKQHMHTSIRSEKKVVPPRDCSADSTHSSPNHQSESITTRRSKSAVMKPVPEVNERPESTVSVDSNVSNKAQASDSRPVSLVVGQQSSTEADNAGKNIDNCINSTKLEQLPNIKPFVRDWVVKHSVEAQDDSLKVGCILDSGNQVIGTLESVSNYKRQNAIDPKSRRLNSASSTPLHSPKNSPISLRKHRTEQTKPAKSDLTSSPHPCTRVAEWLTTVSTSQASDLDSGVQDTSMSSDSKTDNPLSISGSRHNSPCRVIEQPEKVDASTEPLDNDVENMEMSWLKPEEMGGKLDDLSCSTSDFSRENDNDENDAVLSMNRESIYEMQMDEQLERIKHSDPSKLLCEIADDETFSSVSGTKETDISDNNDDVAKLDEATETEICQIICDKNAQTSSELNLNLGNAPISESPVSEYDNSPSSPIHINRPLHLRRPDGASNPNLTLDIEEVEVGYPQMKKGYIPIPQIPLDFVSSQLTKIARPMGIPTTSKTSELLTRSGDGQSSDDALLGGDICVHLMQAMTKPTVKSKPPIPSKPASRSTSLPKPLLSLSPIVNKQPLKSVTKDTAISVKSNDKSSSGKLLLSFSHNSRSKEKVSKSSNSQRSVSQPNTSLSRTNSGKSSTKSQSPSKTKLPIFSSKSSSSSKESKSKKKEKESKGSAKASNSRLQELVTHKSRSTDSDSGNDSGIVAHDKKRLLSPYATVTKPRTPSHSSSGHGSDNSSSISADVRSQPECKSDKLHGGTSSGYESMLRDSEGTVSSSAPEDSTSEGSTQDTKKGSKLKKKGSSTRRSRSAPARTPDTPPGSRKQSPSCSRKAGSPSSKAWVDTRHLQRVKEEPFEIKKYDVNDVERLQRRRQEEAEARTLEQRKERVRELLCKQDEQKQELSVTKEHLLIERSSWSFDCKLLMCFSCRPRKTDV